MIRNAQIISTMFGREDHGIMTFMITIRFGNGTTVGIGGYPLDEGDYLTGTGARLFKTNYMEIISEILRVVGVNSWEELKGKYIRFEDTGSKVTKIGNLIEEKWIDLDSFVWELKKANN